MNDDEITKRIFKIIEDMYKPISHSSEADALIRDVYKQCKRITTANRKKWR
jgi:hypothetical protein